MANKYMQSCSTSLAVVEIEIKTIMGYHYTPIRRAKTEKW